MEKLIIIGAGGHARTIVDTIERSGRYEIAGYVAENADIGVGYGGYPVIGCDDGLQTIYEKGVHLAIIGIGYLGNSSVRDTLYKKLKDIGYSLPVIIDDSAIVAKDAEIGEGTYIGRRAVVNVNSKVGNMCIINTGAIVEHDCEVGDFTHIAVGAVLCGGSKIGSHCLIGANATVIQTCTIEDDCIIGANSLVRKDIKGMTCIVGNNEPLGGVLL